MQLMKFMQVSVIASVFPVLFINTASASAIDKEGYYADIKLSRTFQKATGMETSLRPGIGEFVAGTHSQSLFSQSLAFGYQFGNGWRSEGEYSLPKNSEYTSGSSVFATSFNHHKVNTSRLMFNVYRDFQLFNNVSVYGTAGLGVARIKSSGWQGNTGRVYGENTDTNLVYSLGAGVSYAPVDNLSLSLGYRFVDLGKAESGLNLFVNARKLQDEQMKAHVYNNEVYIGAKYVF